MCFFCKKIYLNYVHIIFAALEPVIGLNNLVGMNLQEHTFYFYLNCLFLNLISNTVRAENLFFSLPSPLKKKHFL